jgi:hypothetical protein
MWKCVTPDKLMGSQTKVINCLTATQFYFYNPRKEIVYLVLKTVDNLGIPKNSSDFIIKVHFI